MSRVKHVFAYDSLGSYDYFKMCTILAYCDKHILEQPSVVHLHKPNKASQWHVKFSNFLSEMISQKLTSLTIY